MVVGSSSSIAEQLFDGEAVSEGALLRGATELQVEDREWLDLVHVMPRDGILDGKTDVVDAVGQTTQSLLPLLRFILWSPANDHHDGAQLECAHKNGLKRGKSN